MVEHREANPRRGLGGQGGLMRKTLLLMLALSTMAILLATPAFAPTYPPDLELTASAWHILNPNTSATLHNDGAGALYFDFPSSQTGAARRLETGWSAITSTISGRIMSRA